MMNGSKVFNSRSGMSLASVLVSAAIGAIVIGGMASFLTQFNKGRAGSGTRSTST